MCRACILSVCSRTAFGRPEPGRSETLLDERLVKSSFGEPGILRLEESLERLGKSRR
jgi:hypothetical protein